MSLAPLLLLGGGAVALIAMGRQSQASNARRSSNLPGSSNAPGPSSNAAVCTYDQTTMPLTNESRVRLWARCSGRTAQEVEILIARGVQSGQSAAWADGVRRAYQQAQALTNRPPEPVSPAARREIDRFMNLSDAAAQGSALGRVPDTLSRKAEGAGAAAAQAGVRARAEQQPSARTPAEATARARAVQAENQRQAQVSGSELDPSRQVGSDSDPTVPNPTMARHLASQTARAVRLRLVGWQNNLRMFQVAAGMLPTGIYDAETRASLVRFGIRNAPEVMK